VYDGDKSYKVNERQATLQHQPREPVVIAPVEKLFDDIHKITRANSALQTSRCSLIL
jgi:hypothetical protein